MHVPSTTIASDHPYVRCVHLFMHVQCLLPVPFHARTMSVACTFSCQNHIYTAYVRYFWQGNYHIYGHIRCIYTVLANPTVACTFSCTYDVCCVHLFMHVRCLLRAPLHARMMSVACTFSCTYDVCCVYLFMHVRCLLPRVGQNHIHTVYARYFWQGNYHIYSHIRCIYTVLANPTDACTFSCTYDVCCLYLFMQYDVCCVHLFMHVRCPLRAPFHARVSGIVCLYCI